MANYCTNDFVFYSTSKELLTELHHQMYTFFQHHRHPYVNDFLETMEVPLYDSITAEGRHFFTYCAMEIRQEGEYYLFEASTESAWNPYLIGFQVLLKERYNDDICMVTKSEEPGCGLFYNDDFTGRFFPEQYYVTVGYEGEYFEEPFVNLAEIEAYLIKTYPGYQSKDVESEIGIMDCFSAYLDAIEADGAIQISTYEAA